MFFFLQMFGWWMIFRGEVFLHYHLETSQINHCHLTAVFSSHLGFVCFGFSGSCLENGTVPLCSQHFRRCIDHVIRMQWAGERVKTNRCKGCSWKRLVSLRNSQINRLWITNYLVSSYGLIAIPYGVSVCSAWVHVWLVHLAESTEAEFSVITKEKNQCGSTLDLCSLYSKHHWSKMTVQKARQLRGGWHIKKNPHFSSVSFRGDVLVFRVLWGWFNETLAAGEASQKAQWMSCVAKRGVLYSAARLLS